MLASLLRGNSGQKGAQYPESVTDDAHTRNLLFGHSEQVFNLTTSPPASPFGSPTLRPSSYDDHGGLELEEKDVRVLLAQDIYSGSAGPTLLFDSHKPPEDVTPAGRGQPVARSQLPTNWRAPQSPQAQAEETFRNRSSTFSGTQSSWGKATKDLALKEDPFMECMFGAPSAAKTASSTKMHIIPAKSRPMNASDRLPRRPPENVEPRRRAPLGRALTSGQQPTLSTLEDNKRDLLLITRLFHISLEDNAKVPAFAVGFVLQLPYPLQRPASAQSRAAFNPNASFNLASATSSFGSDMQSSWTFLDAIPASLSSSMTFSDDGDRRVDAIVSNWDVILRSISSFERVARAVVNEQLESILARVAEPRSGPRIIAVHDAGAIGRVPSLSSAANDISRRIVYAIRIPRVVTGLGVSAGHWNDEARMLYRSCGGRQQNFFLFNLLTAFLGNHMQWLERLAPEWYRKQFQANHKKPDEPRILASRTIIVSEHKGLARRLIYILASFLPGRSGIDGLDRVSDESAIATSSSPSNNFNRAQYARRSSKPSIRSAQMVGDPSKQLLSTSASSQNSLASINRSPRKSFMRKDSNKFLVTRDAIISKPEVDNKQLAKESVGTISAVVPNAAATPIAYISSRRDSYFPESPLVETNDSLASADLAKVLHKASFSHRRTSSVSSRWGSLVSGISEIWSNKQSTPGDRGSVTTASQGGSPSEQHKRSASSAVSIGRSNPLQMMVDELDQGQTTSKKSAVHSNKQSAASPGRQSVRTFSATPRLHVDDKDGVVDVELDLPGFLSVSSLTPPQHHQHRAHVKGTSFNRDCSDSIYSMRSTARSPGNNDEQINVGGYLRRHHEDFVLHAVRPYNELLDEVKRAMRAEPTPQEVKDQVLQQALPMWVSICTTLVADTKPFSIHRMTLRRKFELKSSYSGEDRENAIVDTPNVASLNLLKEEITDEVVMEFDTTLADAVEKALNVGMADPARSATATRTHSRNVSVSSVRGVVPSPSQAQTEEQHQQNSGKTSPAKTDHRNPVLGALEDVVRSVNHDLNKSGQPREPEAVQKLRTKPIQQENALREGVKNWMLSVEQTSVW